MRINHNIAALNTHRQLTTNTAGASKSLEKLSSGFRINRAGDDAAGLAISEKMRGQIRGLEMASKNAQDSISLIQTAEGAMNEVHSILQRMRELSVQAVNDTNTTSDRQELQKEINQLTSEVNRIGNTTEFNEKKLLNGDLSANLMTNSGMAGLSGTSVTVDVTKAIDQTITVTNGELKAVFDSGSKANIDIKISGTANNGFEWANFGGNGDADLIITKNASGTAFEVSFSGTASGASGQRTLKIDADAVAFDAETNMYSYSNQGISFSFSGGDVEGWEAGDKLTISLASGESATGTYNTNTENRFNTGLSVSGATNDPKLEDITVTSGAAILADVAQVHVTYSSSKLTVNLLTASGATVSSTELSANSGQVINYNSDGISFKFTAATSGDQTTAVGSGTFDLEVATQTIELSSTSGTSGTGPTYRDASLVFQTGSNENQTTTLAVEDVRALALGIVSTSTAAGFSSGANVTKGTDGVAVEFALDITTSENAAKAITVLDEAIKKVSSERSKLGAVQNRLEHTINNLGTSAENLTAAESRIRDVDMAKEMMGFTKDNILTQAAQAMLAQANQQPQGVLQLLR